MKRTIILIAISILGIASYAQNAESLYTAQQYDKALSALQQTEHTQGASAELYYDMANCYYHLNDVASAVLYYHKALAMDPYLKQAKNNLTYLQQKVNDRNQAEMGTRKGNILPEEPSVFERVYRWIAIDNSSNMWAWCAAGCFILFAICVLLYVIPRMVLLRKIGFFGGIAALLCCLVLLVFASMAASGAKFGEIAIIKQMTVKLKSEPSDNAKDVTTPIVQGSELKVLESRTDVSGIKWSRLHLNNDNEGWIKDSDIITFSGI